MFRARTSAAQSRWAATLLPFASLLFAASTACSGAGSGGAEDDATPIVDDDTGSVGHDDGGTSGDAARKDTATSGDGATGTDTAPLGDGGKPSDTGSASDT